MFAVGPRSLLVNGGLYAIFLQMCPFDSTDVAGSGKVRPVNYTYRVVVVTPTGHPKLVHNRGYRTFWCRLCVVTLPIHFVSIGDFVIGLSNISSFSLDLGDMTLGKVYDTPLVHQQLGNIIQIKHDSK